MLIQIHDLIPQTRAEGPGLRFCIQVQGCSIRCKGCALPQTWSPHEGKTMRTRDLIKYILETPDIQGITLLGGEPFEQAEALSEIAEQVKAHGLSVVTFSGYSFKKLKDSKKKHDQRLLQTTDLLISGPFQQNQMDLTRPWIGSRNQEFHFLTDRYSELSSTLASLPNRLEIRIKEDGSIFINGMATIEQLNSLIKT